MKQRKHFTVDDYQFINSMIGIMPAQSIATHIGTTIDCVTRYCKQHDVSMLDKRHENGIPVYHLAKLWNCNHNTITVFISHNELPLLPLSSDIGKMFRIVDKKRLPEWLSKGYALSKAIRPTLPEYVNMLNNARQQIYAEKIPTLYLQRVLFINGQSILKWCRTGKLPEHDFKFANVLYHNRVKLALYIREHYGRAVSERVLTAKWSME
jgi:hypothetical protein